MNETARMDKSVLTLLEYLCARFGQHEYGWFEENILCDEIMFPSIEKKDRKTNLKIDFCSAFIYAKTEEQQWNPRRIFDVRFPEGETPQTYKGDSVMINGKLFFFYMK